MDDSGAVLDPPEEVDAPAANWNMLDRAITWPNGDAGWVYHRGCRGELEVYRFAH